MIILNSIEELNIEEPSAIAIGKFDGIHIGHKKLLKCVCDKAKEKGYLSVVFTFDMSAASFFAGKDIKEVTTLPEKRIIFNEMGIDILVEYPLNKESASISPEAFIEEILVKKLKMKYIAAGDDISFGNRGLGNAKMLKDMSKVYDYCVDIIDKVMIDNVEISSTLVRSKIAEGNMEEVSKLLGHPYSFTGVVSSGKRLGRTMGMPTMNQYPDESKILPPFGVYYSNVFIRGVMYHGITNIGIRPTVSDNMHVSVETYLYDFSDDAYGESIVTQLLMFKRSEMKFKDKEELRDKMKKDLEEGRMFHGIKGE